MNNRDPLVDIHCHLLPEIDDGSDSLGESIAMARMATEDGISAIVCTPHQLGAYRVNTGDRIRQHVTHIQGVLNEHDIPLTILPGGDVRIEPDMIDGLRRGEVLTLGDHGKHVLLELPHEIYFPLESVLEQLRSIGMVGILSHPERNQGILNEPDVVRPLVEKGCLMQVTAGSLMGTFGPRSQQLCEWMLEEELVHFVSTDAHGAKKRRPLLSRAYERVASLVGEEIAVETCCKNPSAVARGKDVDISSNGRNPNRSGWFGLRRSA